LYDASKGAIWESIEAMDLECMQAIESLDPRPFRDVQKKYENTICGRHPIGILLQMMVHSQTQAFKFKCSILSYAQSSKCTKQSDSSVSYASIMVSS
jgi:AmmeMemoRadiSam system protein B